MDKSKKMTQNVILHSSKDAQTPDSTRASKTKVVNNSIKKSRRKTSLKEFCTIKGLRPEVTAGFTAYLKGDNFHFDEEWEQIYNEYVNRKL